MAQTVKNLPAMWENWVLSLGQEDPLKKGMTTHCSILAYELPRTEEPGGLQSMELQRAGHDWTMTNTFTFSAWPGFPQGLLALPIAPTPAGDASLPSQHSLPCPSPWGLHTSINSPFIKFSFLRSPSASSWSSSCHTHLWVVKTLSQITIVLCLPLCSYYFAIYVFFPTVVVTNYKRNASLGLPWQSRG